ncbi:mariner Mos1 transposase [Trichonephila clavipes]|nr:mariner Mos1 transposase [Trichonephila clavipes]
MDAVISGIVHMDNIAAENSIIQPDNAKTRQATRYGVRLFREYCVQHGVDTINNLPPREIAAMLKGFYGQARTKDGQRFSVNSLIAIRYAISRYYRSPMVHRKIDIVKDSAFNDANETFRAVLKDLERESRGTACQKELQMVDMDDRRKLRHYFEHAISTPRGLLQKVWYDLMLRVGRRGRESQRLLNRNSFRIAKTADGRQYIYQVDDEEAGIILEIPGDPLCPVKTLKFYLGRLNPACRALFQRPKEHIYEQDTCWYVNSPVGKNMLATMMSTISKCARLSRIYTNVRIRATTYSPADGKGCIPCTDVAEGPIREQEARDIKLPEKRPPEIAPKPVQVTQNSHIIKQLNAPIVQACLSVAVSNSLSSVTNAGSFINRVFPIALAGVPKNELMNGQAINIVNKPTETEPFLDKLITRDKKKEFFMRLLKEKKSYCKPGTSSATVPKPSIHQRKVLLCLWWDRKGPVYYELLKQVKTINADLYCNQLDKLNAAIKEKRPALASRKGIVFHHDNARPHTAMVTQQKLNALGWEVLGHPPYSPDITPSD